MAEDSAHALPYMMWPDLLQNELRSELWHIMFLLSYDALPQAIHQQVQCHRHSSAPTLLPLAVVAV